MTPTSRYTLRDLPPPAKLVVSAFLISVGIGYLWAMAQIHFKHASPGNPMPTNADLVARFSGVPWPLVPKPDPAEEEAKKAAADKAQVAVGVQVPAVKVKTIIKTRCVVCHGPDGDESDKPLTNHDEVSNYMKPTTDFPKGQLHQVLTGDPKLWNRKSMVKAFTEKVEGWKDMSDEEKKAARPQREAERLAVVAWVEAGAPKAPYEADAFPLTSDIKDLAPELRTTAPPLNPAAVNAEKKPVDPWKAAKQKQMSVDSLTQSTHAHLLSFAMLWALTGMVFAFTSYSCFVRSVLAPVVLVAQVLDVGCWWLARLPDVGPYFALAIMATGAVVGMGLGAQITLSLWNMWGGRGRAVLFLLFLLGAGAFGLVFVKVIGPQLEAEKALAAGNNG